MRFRSVLAATIALLVAAAPACERDAARPSRAASPTEPREPAPTPAPPPTPTPGPDPAPPPDPIAAVEQSAGASRPNPRAPIRITARFVAREGGVPHCGVVYAVELMVYDVVAVEQGAVDGERIVVAQGCPEFLQAQLGLDSKAPSFFQPGGTYRLELSTRFPATASQRPRPWPRLAGHDLRDDAVLYWAETTARVK